jgi:hypothetical protein
VIPSRDSIRLRIDCNEIKTIIRDFNQGKANVDLVNVYVIDSLGITTIAKSKSIRKNLKKMIAKDIKVEEEDKRHQQQELAAEKKRKKQEERLIRRQQRKESFAAFKLKVKAKFRRRKKK